MGWNDLRVRLLAVVGISAAAWLFLVRRSADDAAPAGPTVAFEGSKPTAKRVRDAEGARVRRDDSSTERPAEPNSGDGISEFARAWDALDLQAIRRRMPENLVWTLTIPTDDPEVLESRRQARQYWEKLYGRVYSNTASVEEVHAYYAHQQQRSSDYIEFTSYVIDNHADDLREQDLKLLHLARNMHSARLQEIPRRQAEALARRDAHAKAREAWLADQERFATEGQDAPDDEARAAD